MCHCSTAISPPGNQPTMRITVALVTLSIVFVDPINRRFSCLPRLIATVGVSLKFGVLGEKSYQKRIWLQALKATLT